MVELDIEIWPTSIVVPAGYRIGLTIRGKDYVYPGPSGGKLSNFKNELTGCGPFLHDDPRDRPPEIFGGVTSLHFGGAQVRPICCCRSFPRRTSVGWVEPAKPIAARSTRRGDGFRFRSTHPTGAHHSRRAAAAGDCADNNARGKLASID